MEHDTATNLASFMKSAWPHAYFPEDSMATYANLFARLDSPGAAYAAVRDLVESEADLPSWAAIREVYDIKRRREVEAAESQSRLGPDRQIGQGATVVEGNERYLQRQGEYWRALRSGKEIPRQDKVREVPPFVKEFLLKLQQNAKDFDPPDLPEVAGGRCDDCGSEYDKRYLLGAFALCEFCALARVRVSRDLERGRHDLPTFYKEPKDEAAAQAQGAEGKKDALVEEADART